MTERERIDAFKAAWAEDREARKAWWRKHWLLEVYELVRDLGGATLLGVGLGLASVLWALQKIG